MQFNTMFLKSKYDKFHTQFWSFSQNIILQAYKVWTNTVSNYNLIHHIARECDATHFASKLRGKIGTEEMAQKTHYPN